MNFYGILIGAAVFLCIGIFHPLVIKMEYRFGVKSWLLFLILAVIFAVASIFISDYVGSTICGAIAFSSLWSIHEVIKQEQRVLRGWFPENPARHDYYEKKRKTFTPR